jgi:hypothetical protein
LEIIQELKNKGFPLIGGDVWKRVGTRVKSTGDNWYYNQKHGESFEIFVECSFRHAIQYIENYPSEGDRFFVLIFGNQNKVD